MTVVLIIAITRIKNAKQKIYEHTNSFNKKYTHKLERECPHFL